ncbi:MAG: hypothetical protein QXN35_05735 [Ignisphaera sp.]|uniref:Uncharacterized protein n=1 Tax=Ignisphaera aggregans TaxID=334771 RepID=A0A7C4H2P8_9CREN
MPRKGYEVITVTKEAREALNELKIKLNAKSISDAIIRVNELVDAILSILVPERIEKQSYKQKMNASPIRIQIKELKKDES